MHGTVSAPRSRRERTIGGRDEEPQTSGEGSRVVSQRQQLSKLWCPLARWWFSTLLSYSTPLAEFIFNQVTPSPDPTWFGEIH